MRKIFIGLLFSIAIAINAFPQAFNQIISLNWKTADGLPYNRDFSGSYSTEVFRQIDKTKYAFLSKTERSIIIFNIITGEKEKTIYLPFFPIDFAASEQYFFVASLRYLYTLDTNGHILTKQYFGDKIKFVDDIKIIDNQVYLISFNGDTWSFNKPEKILKKLHKGIILKDNVYGEIVKQGKHVFSITIFRTNNKPLTKTFSEKNHLGTLKLIGMSDKYLFVEVQSVLHEVPLRVSSEIRCYKINTTSIDYLFSVPIPDIYYTYIKHNSIVAKSGLNILVSSPEKTYLFCLPEINENLKLKDDKIYLPHSLYLKSYNLNEHLLPSGSEIYDEENQFPKSPITRQQIIDNAEPYATHQWYCNANNIKDYDCGGVHVTTPSWVTVGNQVSIPYMWGGFSSLTQFDQGLLDGVSAGDSYTVGNGAGSACAVGVDCSGFVSIAWGLPVKYGTSTLPNISTAYASFDELLPGDIVNYAGSHVRLVHTVNGNGSFLLIEAAASATNWRVGYNTYTTADLQTNYIPRYYDEVINDPPDTINPTTHINANIWETTNFQVTFSDNDNIAIDKRFYQVCYFSGATWLANNNNGFLNDNFNNGISPQWTTYSGTWNNSSGALIQTDEVNSNTNIYAPVSQTVGNIYLYHWQMKIEGSGTNRRAGIYIMVDSPTAIQRNNAYMIYFRVDQNTCQIYKSVNDVIDLKTDDSCPVDLGIWFDAKVIFNTTTGEINVFKDNVLVSSWIDTTPLTAGTHISFRTGEAIVSYDNMKVYRSRSTSEFVSIGTNGDIPYQNVSPSQPASVILSVVTDTANNISNIDSAYINIDWTQPTPSSYVADGTSNDIDTTFDATQLSANWDAAIDNNSGIASYYYCIGSSPGTDDIVSWTNNSNILSTTEGSLLLNYNSTYFVSVTAMNNAGLFSDTLISDGIIVLSPTSIPLYENNDDSFAIYPVPAKDIIIVSSLLQEEITDKPQIYSISGKLIPVKISRIDSKTFEINLQSVSSGIFFLKLKTKSGYRTKVFSVVP